ncbi:recQ-mediated genome instability protein 2 isoform X2 [Passer domesticus]|uniref:recQ-mediated genome instability protein 2 isoform X2 n=1 Tax=Passer domesticus TaxID=48849 RepID=UPI0030FE36D5
MVQSIANSLFDLAATLLKLRLRDLTAEITTEIFRRFLLCSLDVTPSLNQCTQEAELAHWKLRNEKVMAEQCFAASQPDPGKYVMVMGVVRCCSPEPVLRAIKMTDLSENPIHKSMWDLEVEDLHRVLP